jgi:hypothetical protein
MKTTEKVLRQAALILKDQNFIARHRLEPTAFTRRRKLPFERIVSTLIHLVRNSLQIVCNRLGEHFHMDDPASKQAFSQARSNLSYSCFQELNDLALQTFYQEDKAGIWKERRIIAADGSTLRLPESSNTLAYFGRFNCGKNVQADACPVMGRISEFTDVMSGLTISAALLPTSVGEESMAKGQLQLVAEKMRLWGQDKLLFVYDRGYPSKEFVLSHLILKVDFVFRIPSGFNQQIDAFVASGKMDGELKLYDEAPVLRIAVFPLASGEQEVLLTSLMDKAEVTHEELFSVYGARWRAMEEGYKRQKVQFELQNWATENTMGVLQEFWAMIYIVNVVAMSCYELEGPSSPGKDLKERLNRSVLFGSMKDDVLRTLGGELSAENFTKKFKKLARRAKVPVKPGRHFSRDGLGQPKRFFPMPRVC